MSSVYHNPLNTKLTEEQSKDNAVYIRDYLLNKGWSINAICGVLGNFHAETYQSPTIALNPNVYEGWKLRSSELGKYGYGLPQWTPWLGTATYNTPEEQRNYHGNNSPTYGRWCYDNGLEKSLMETQLEFIHKGLGGYSTKWYAAETGEVVSWSEFIVSDRPPNELAKIFYRNYERSEKGEYGSRPNYADYWYEYLTGDDAPVPTTPSGGSNNTIISSAISWAVGIANDDTHGYDQADRWGDDYDCSSLIIQAYEQAGCPVKTNGASSTANMREVFVQSGFAEYVYSDGMYLVAGDVLWREGHCAMYIGGGQIVSAHINELGTVTGGQTGDQTGEEIDVSSFDSSGEWLYILRLPASNIPNIKKNKGLPKLLLYAIATEYF